MSRRSPSPLLVDDDLRLPITVYLTPEQSDRLDQMLDILHAIDPGTDDNAVVDRLFAAGLDTEWKTLQEITP